MLLDATESGDESRARRAPVERRMDDFAELAKESAQLATKVRATLDSIADSARRGDVMSADSQLARAAASAADLTASVDRLAQAERHLELRGERANLADYVEELRSELTRRGIRVDRGPDPYWLAYPAWFKVERSVKGAMTVVLNGDRLDSLKPSVVADNIHESVSEKFDPKPFTELLISVRRLLQRAGVPGQTLGLDDIYGILTVEPAKRGTRRKDFSRAAFYYSVHRLAEHFDTKPDAPIDFPDANRSDVIFFDSRGNSRKYLTITFTDGGHR